MTFTSKSGKTDLSVSGGHDSPMRTSPKCGTYVCMWIPYFAVGLLNAVSTIEQWLPVERLLVSRRVGVAGGDAALG